MPSLPFWCQRINITRIELRVIDKNSCVLRVRLRHGLTAEERRDAIEEQRRVLDKVFVGIDMEHITRSVEERKDFKQGKAQLIVAQDDS